MDLLRRAFRDIAAGHTRATILGRPAFIRHLSYSDQTDLDLKREEFLAAAREDEMPTNAEREEALRKEGLWSDEKERVLARAKSYIADLEEGKRKPGNHPSMVAGYVKKIEEATADWRAKDDEKRKLMGATAEVWADIDLNDHYILVNLFSDVALTVPLFREGEFDYFKNDRVSEIVGDYNRAMEGCNEAAIKRLAMSPIFQRPFQLTGDQLLDMFGKPACALTFYQADLLRFGAHFRNIYQNHDMASWPKKVLEDPDLLSEYASSVTKGKAEMQAKGANEEGTVVLGLKKEDAKALGVKTGNPMAELMKVAVM